MSYLNLYSFDKPFLSGSGLCYPSSDYYASYQGAALGCPSSGGARKRTTRKLSASKRRKTPVKRKTTKKTKRKTPVRRKTVTKRKVVRRKKPVKRKVVKRKTTAKRRVSKKKR